MSNGDDDSEASDASPGDGDAVDESTDGADPDDSEEFQFENGTREADDGADPSDGTDADASDDAEVEADAADEEEADDGLDEDLVDADPESLNERLDGIEADLEDAETEADLDDVEAVLDAVTEAVEAADLPEPDEDDEDAEDPAAELEDRIETLREDLETQRGPYAADVVTGIEEAEAELADAEWTERGEGEAVAAVEAFLDAVGETLDASFDDAGADPDAAATTLDEAAQAVEEAALDPDADSETIAELVDASDALADDLESAEVWDDLSVRQKMEAEWFYDPLTSENRRDFPPELSVVRIAEQENDPERVLMALEYLTSDFMEENCIDALRRMGSEEAYDAMMARAQKRDRPAIEVLGKIADERAVDTLVDYIQDESNPPLQKTVLRALGEIGSPEATQDVADRLVAEDPEVRSAAARALGMIGDTRAVDPLANRITDDDHDPSRAAAAWALNRIGTERALESAAAYADDRSYLVQQEAERAAEALETPEARA